MSGEKWGKGLAEKARDAMKAIKKDDKRIEREDKRDILNKENALKNEIEEKVKKKLRKVLKEEEEDEESAREIDESFLVSWEFDPRYNIHIGMYEDKKMFRINRGFYLFHLYVTSKEILIEDWRRNSHTSINLYSLKTKCDNFLKSTLAENKKNNQK